MMKLSRWVVNPEYPNIAPLLRTLPERFAAGEGQLIQHVRNELRRMEWEGQTYVVKSFQSHPLNRYVYGRLRPSKAERSYRYALALLQAGVGTPQPVAFADFRDGLSLSASYYVSALSPCPYVYGEIFQKPFDCEDELMREVGRFTARLHDHGFALLDYSRGNLLFSPQPDGHVELEVIDLNRMRLGPVGMDAGCENLKRLPASPHQHRLIAEAYAAARGFDADTCYRLMRAYRSKQPAKLPQEGFENEPCS